MNNTVATCLYITGFSFVTYVFLCAVFNCNKKDQGSSNGSSQDLQEKLASIYEFMTVCALSLKLAISIAMLMVFLMAVYSLINGYILWQREKRARNSIWSLYGLIDRSKRKKYITSLEELEKLWRDTLRRFREDELRKMN